MEQLFNWIRNVSYDLFAILLPGAVLGTAIYGILHFLPVVRGIIQDAELDISLSNGSNLLLVVTISYILGMLLKEAGSVGFIANIYSKERKDYSSKELYDLALSKVTDRYEIDSALSWPDFYLIVRNEVMTSKLPTLTVTYQNRYELYRSLSIASAFVAVIQLVISIIMHYVFDGTVPLYQSLMQISIIVLSLFSAWLFRSGHLKYWEVFGDHIISHALTYDQTMTIQVNRNGK